MLTSVWRRVRDSNPRYLSVHSISSAAPSTTRTTLHVPTFFYNFFSHFQPQLSLAFQKFSGSRGEKRREKRDYAKNVKSKKLVFMRVCGQKVSMNPKCFRVRAVITTSIPLHRRCARFARTLYQQADAKSRVFSRVCPECFPGSGKWRGFFVFLLQKPRRVGQCFLCRKVLKIPLPKPVFGAIVWRCRVKSGTDWILEA